MFPSNVIYEDRQQSEFGLQVFQSCSVVTAPLVSAGYNVILSRQWEGLQRRGQTPEHANILPKYEQAANWEYPSSTVNEWQTGVNSSPSLPLPHCIPLTKVREWLGLSKSYPLLWLQAFWKRNNRDQVLEWSEFTVEDKSRFCFVLFLQKVIRRYSSLEKSKNNMSFR